MRKKDERLSSLLLLCFFKLQMRFLFFLKSLLLRSDHRSQIRSDSLHLLFHLVSFVFTSFLICEKMFSLQTNREDQIEDNSLHQLSQDLSSIQFKQSDMKFTVKIV